ncbi:hypothetical protein H2202_005133 [Exophiala xenobiotica]|nr:hypothetical protein H2202_005133 [Exophiala xenobiotica]KAK5205386.1 hypothetical protein LTR41_008840 [Exophiala xenobiotica]KAK5413447.1 hypothetical protein LTR06_004874 [Exophiala xenobiotica]
MSWDTGAPPAAGAETWNGGGDAWNDGGAGNQAAAFDDGFGGQTNGDFNDGVGAGGGENGDSAAHDGGCRNCGQEGHFARDCPEPRKMGACFNCGEEGHSKTDCPNPRKFKGECRNCGQEGHMASDCPTRVDKCKNCQQEGHTAMECKNPKVIDNARVAEKSENEAWDLLKTASDERDITDFKEGILVLSKAAPDYTYPRLEKEFRKRGYSIYLIAMEKDHGDTWTNVNLQGETGKKYAVSYFLSDKPQRPTLLDKWPPSAEENLTRLADAGTPLDRGVDKCSNCEEVGHNRKSCPQEPIEREKTKVLCHLCGEEGHRVRDCKEERKKAGRTCKICDEPDHIAKDCPNREKQTCRNCGAEDHMARECPNREKRTCRNCGEEDHIAKDCPQPRKARTDWSEVVCSVCDQKGHGRARCPEAKKGDPGFEHGKETANADSGAAVGGGWEDNTTGGSAQADWEQGPASVPAATTVSTGGW